MIREYDLNLHQCQQRRGYARALGEKAEVEALAAVCIEKQPRPPGTWYAGLCSERSDDPIPN
ncbi:MAG: hypothetical protein ACLTDS_02015 [Bianqueaceae bacterium]